jgi:hypothetical protein
MQANKFFASTSFMYPIIAHKHKHMRCCLNATYSQQDQQEQQQPPHSNAAADKRFSSWAEWHTWQLGAVGCVEVPLQVLQEALEGGRQLSCLGVQDCQAYLPGLVLPLRKLCQRKLQLLPEDHLIRAQLMEVHCNYSQFSGGTSCLVQLAAYLLMSQQQRRRRKCQNLQQRVLAATAGGDGHGIHGGVRQRWNELMGS